MRFNLEGLDVFFPYDRIYLEQYQYMRALKQTLDAGGHCLLEMPTGTGKTVCLLSLITSYQLANPNCGKLVYCTRTVPEMNSVMEELGTVLAYRSEQLGAGSGVLALCLSSRRNMCIHERVLRESDREGIDAACRSMTAPWAIEKAQKARQQQSAQVVETCEYYDGFQSAGEATSMPSGVYDLEELRKWGKNKNWCPYYLTRQAINHASVLVFNYQYMLDPKVAKMVSKELESESIIVFDEAHNIDSVCIEALSVDIHERNLEQATRSLGRLSSEVSRIKASDGARLQAEYQNLVNGLVDQGLLDAPAAAVGLSSNVLSPDVINEAVPGNIRRAEHFIAFMKKIVEHLKTRLRAVSGPRGGVISETPLAFLHRMITTTSLEAKPLKFAYSRLSSLLRTLQVPNLDDFNALTDVADFASLVATYAEGLPRFAIIMEPNGSSIPGALDPVIQLACLDASLAIAPLFKRFGSVVITSGTLSPIDLYPKLLQFEPCVSESFNMSTFRPCIRPLVITRGSDQLPVSTKFDDRDDMGVVRNYGSMLVELCSSIPDGVVAFFTSYSYMESIISEWDGMGILRQLTKSKLVFIETKDVVETTLALDNYRRACDSGRGAVFLSVARGKVSEGINFDRHYGRAVIMFGVPFQYTLSHILRARLEYLQTHYQIREQDFLNFDALRQASQCVGRVIRSKIDYGLMIFADSRYNRHDKRSKLPKWILQFLGDGQLNLSTDTAIAQVKHFLRVMAQPVDQNALKEVLLTLDEVQAMSPPTLRLED
ncbi:nucleotide excision repair protein ERCC2 [Thalassiosira pseudonana CCMP1335]|uniref:DNA 5'-3' helicase n=1 Tax=Thalassiosira pseudonana TaxID=35128 RepID=B8C2D9_THAPS|nr:nucleotide excision repair protein ERCC2 [Thalassiosira pseudonana CCMP1335]EED91935.1 nucleotide excision repair protein ERCC2 [Thalassiosira pseudonana CCMP1335]